MNTRLQQFIVAENISQAQFADSIGVARASISHILSGRNKPGFDFIESMLKTYPSLNPDWLILGKGKMYKSSFPSPEVVREEPAVANMIKYDGDDLPEDTGMPTLFEEAEETATPTPATPTPTPAQTQPQAPEAAPAPIQAPTPTQAPAPAPATQQPIASSISLNVPSQTIADKRHGIERIVIFYTDNTYQEFK